MIDVSKSFPFRSEIMKTYSSSMYLNSINSSQGQDIIHSHFYIYQESSNIYVMKTDRKHVDITASKKHKDDFSEAD